MVGAQLLQLLEGVKGGGVMDGHSWLAEADDDDDGGGDGPGAAHGSDGGEGGAARAASASLMTSLAQGAHQVSPGGAVGGFPEAAPTPAPGASASAASPPPSAGHFHADGASSPGGEVGRSTPAPPPSAGRYHAAAAGASASATTSHAAAAPAATNDAAGSGRRAVLSAAMLPPSGASRSTAEAGAAAATAAPRVADDRRRRSSAGAPAGLGSPLPTLPARASSSVSRAETIQADEDVPAQTMEQSPDTVAAGAGTAEAMPATQAGGHSGTTTVILAAEMAMRQPEASPPSMAAAELRSWQQQLQQTRNIQLALTVLTLVPALLLAMYARG